MKKKGTTTRVLIWEIKAVRGRNKTHFDSIKMEQVPRRAPLRSLNPLTDYSTVFLPFSPEEEELVSRLLRDDDIIPAGPLDFGSPEAPKRKLGDLAADYLNAPSVTGIDCAAAKRLKLNQKHEGSAVKKLACPFFKRDGHNTAISRPCRGPGWDSISRVKYVLQGSDLSMPYLNE